MEVGLRVRDRTSRGCTERAYVFFKQAFGIHIRIALLVDLALNEASPRHLLIVGCFTGFAIPCPFEYTLEQLSLRPMRELLGVLKLIKLPISGPHGAGTMV